MLEQVLGDQRVTVGGDKRFDTADFVSECRHMQVTPHVAQNDTRRGAAPSTSGRPGTKATASAKESGSGSRNVSDG